MRPAVELINSSRNQYLLHHADARFGDIAEPHVLTCDGVGEAQVIEADDGGGGEDEGAFHRRCHRVGEVLIQDGG